MKLDRNINANGKGKYALLKLRNLPERGRQRTEIEAALVTLSHYGILDYGDTEDSDFFVMRLKDKYATAALATYSQQAKQDGQIEYAAEIYDLAQKSAKHPNLKRPD